MSAIAATSSVSSYSTGATLSTPSQPKVTQIGRLDPRPSVVTNIETALTGDGADQDVGSLDPNEIGKVLTSIGGYNGFVSIYEHMDWARIAAKFGDAAAADDKAKLLNGIESDGGFVASEASGSGIPFQQPVSADEVKNGAAPALTTVNNFTFTHAGSTYAVTNGPSGTLVGTKDGKAWLTWQLIPLFENQAAADIALNSLTANTHLATVATKNTLKVDLSA